MRIDKAANVRLEIKTQMKKMYENILKITKTDTKLVQETST